MDGFELELELLNLSLPYLDNSPEDFGNQGFHYNNFENRPEGIEEILDFCTQPSPVNVNSVESRLLGPDWKSIESHVKGEIGYVHAPEMSCELEVNVEERILEGNVVGPETLETEETEEKFEGRRVGAGQGQGSCGEAVAESDREGD